MSTYAERRGWRFEPGALVRVPGGRRVTMGAYAAAWKRLKTMDPEAEVKGWGGWGFYDRPARVLAEMRRGMHDRISAQLPWYMNGRRWDESWQTEVFRLSRVTNGRVRLRTRDLPAVPGHGRLRREYADRLAHRIDDDE